MLVQISRAAVYSVSSLFDQETFKTFQPMIKLDDFAVINAVRIKVN